MSVNIITTSSFLNYCNICPGQHATQQVSELARSTIQREAEGATVAPILSWCHPFCKHNAAPGQVYHPAAQRRVPVLVRLTPRRTSVLSRAPGPIYFPSNACPTQTEIRNSHEHSLAGFPASLQQKHSKPFKIREGQHRDRRRKGRIRSENFLSLSRQPNLGDINVEVQ